MLNDSAQKIIKQKLADLSKSKFRSSFHLRPKELKYLKEKGYPTIKQHAYDFIIQKLAPASPINDGSQTPMKNHPVFIAQHACACCCRSCLFKWHHIPKYRELTPNEINYIVTLLIAWLKKEEKNISLKKI